MMKTDRLWRRENSSPREVYGNHSSLITFPGSRKVYLPLVVCIELLAFFLLKKKMASLKIKGFTKKNQKVRGCQQVAAGAHIIMRKCHGNLARKREVVRLTLWFLPWLLLRNDHFLGNVMVRCPERNRDFRVRCSWVWIPMPFIENGQKWQEFKTDF